MGLASLRRRVVAQENLKVTRCDLTMTWELNKIPLSTHIATSPTRTLGKSDLGEAHGHHGATLEVYPGMEVPQKGKSGEFYSQPQDGSSNSGREAVMQQGGWCSSNNPNRSLNPNLKNRASQLAICAALPPDGSQMNHYPSACPGDLAGANIADRATPLLPQA